MKTVSPAALAAILDSDAEFALLDVREAGEADAGHIFGASFVPRRMLELRIAELVPERSTAVFTYDEGGARARYAAATLERLGYRNATLLDGGTAAWLASGRKLVPGSNVPSKLFGEQVYESDRVPQLPAAKLRQWQDSGRAHLVCDIRTPEEYAAQRIPGAYGAFGVDLALVAADLREQGVPIVVHCAGRTRSIIAAQSLRALGVNDVQALENGTMGWQVAGYALERGAARGVLQPSAHSIADGEARTRALALGAGVTEICAAELEQRLARRAAGASNTYLVDVRQVSEYAAGHIEGAIALPGGLAIQRTDEFVPVRAAPIVFVDDGCARAFLTAYWFRRFGRARVYVLAGGLKAWQAAGRVLAQGRNRARPLGIDAARAGLSLLTPAALAAMPVKPAVIDVDTSRHFKQARLPGARWVPYGWLEGRIGALAPDKDAALLLCCHNGVHSVYAAANLKRIGYLNVQVLDGGVAAWTRAGLAVESGWPQGMAPAADLVLPPYQSDREAMARYLAWEQELTAGRHASGAAPH